MTDQELKDLVNKLAIDTDRIKAENAAGFAALREAQAETKKELQQLILSAEKRGAHSERELVALTQSMKNTRSEVDGIGKSQGMVAEEFFFNSLSADPTVAGIHYDSVTPRLKRSKQGKSTEIDILLENGQSLAVAEVKYRVRTKDIEQVQQTLATLRDFFPQYKHYAIHAGVAGFSFDDGVVEQAHAQGLFVLTRKGDVIEEDNAQMRVF